MPVQYNKPPKKFTEKQCEEFAFRLEKHFQEYVKERVSKIPHIWMYHPSDKMQKGIPDCIMCVYGEFVAIELKVRNNKTSELQDKELEKISKAYGNIGVAYNWREFKRAVDEAVCLQDIEIEWEV